ncbi:MAG TPA: AraC family transcriptional regulator [Aeromicrobium sp.]|nr:AraC family transcriptional regulator [Aeromicrobium sp.]HKY58001.1 AraC family transcriptional regulator [Aeromicrobium sp.]
MPRPPTSLQVMVSFGEELGVSPEVALAGTGLRPEQVKDPTVEVTPRQELTVGTNVLDALGHPPGLGLELGLRYHLTTYGIWGFALASSPTFRSAIDVGLRYMDLAYSPGTIHARDVGAELQLVLDSPEVPPRLRRFYVEIDASAILQIQRELLGSPRSLVRSVRFAFPPPEQGTARYLEIFGVAPTFDAEETVITFDSALLDAPLPQANEHTTALAQAQCRDLLERRRARTGLAGRVRDVLVTDLADPPGADEVAKVLHVSGRTLRHRLAAEGTSYRALLDEVRQHVAEELLIGAGLTVEQVAHRVGYGDVSSFSHAFRRWHGVGPRAFRLAESNK